MISDNEDSKHSKLNSLTSREDDFLARERDAKFNEWLLNKGLRDKSLEVICSHRVVMND